MFLKKENKNKRIMLMKNHGITTIGPDVPQAMDDLYFFEKQARLQCEMEKMGRNLKDCLIDEKTVQGVYKYFQDNRIR